MAFVFDATRYDGSGNAEWGGSDLELIARLRTPFFYPELAGWSDLALGSAWSDYSCDIYAVHWVDWHADRDEGFLAYLYIKQVHPTFDFGFAGLYMDEVWEYGKGRPWENAARMPGWVQTP